MSREPKTTFSADYIRDISEKVYRGRLGETEAAVMVAGDKDGGLKLRNRAGSYDPLTREYLKALGIAPAAVTAGQSSHKGTEA